MCLPHDSLCRLLLQDSCQYWPVTSTRAIQADPYVVSLKTSSKLDTHLTLYQMSVQKKVSHPSPPSKKIHRRCNHRKMATVSMSVFLFFFLQTFSLINLIFLSDFTFQSTFQFKSLYFLCQGKNAVHVDNSESIQTETLYYLMESP